MPKGDRMPRKSQSCAPKGASSTRAMPSSSPGKRGFGLRLARWQGGAATTAGSYSRTPSHNACTIDEHGPCERPGVDEHGVASILVSKTLHDGAAIHRTRDPSYSRCSSSWRCFAPTTTRSSSASSARCPSPSPRRASLPADEELLSPSRLHAARARAAAAQGTCARSHSGQPATGPRAAAPRARRGTRGSASSIGAQAGLSVTGGAHCQSA